MKQQLIRLGRRVDAYALHRAVYARFALPAGRRFTFTPLELPSGPAVLVRGDLPVGQEVEVPEEGAEARFLLRATVSRHDRESSRRGAWSKGNVQARLAWLGRQATANGFEIIEAGVQVDAVTIERSKGRFWLDASTFTGRLRVTNREQFAAALARGIGKGKAFGFSTLIVSR
jgi:hypothetical protein